LRVAQTVPKQSVDYVLTLRFQPEVLQNNRGSSFWQYQKIIFDEFYCVALSKKISNDQQNAP